ncbi:MULTISPECIES: zinc-binding alcohol dehydrogenase family protein [unclassified Paenibacillus]|uniref:quinone oxidoreductase family protein n=1 Tax=unclassified Paenibacillus TaxID=185978 RepID=UPI0009560370|nr:MULTISPECIES: zinc-binding alcohol dehydrogenase family protein [unclassified Paenibacillus]ASS67537.1 zinc-binding alcohol dehydrogenase family protein [Paenibacillus sp. RUD330]SIQ73533.1 NADPH:quinone reductase [Paenibacillus sp. RU4X]SIQ94959.1 NADPH:quinone reductase [Paenibacillus sp. RU4T]
MHAAVVRSFDRVPQYETFDAPRPSGENEILADVVAAGLHPRVRSQADGSHYTSREELPLIPGIDGVGRLPDGRTVYFVAPDTSYGTLAEKSVVDLRRSVPLPAGADPVLIAAAMNPAMSSWVALRRRVDFQPGHKVLVLGATGSSGQMAVQIAKLLGAGQVIGAGRHQERLDSLPALGADEVVSLAGDPEEAARRLGGAASEVDVVIDYLWGKPAELAMLPLLKRRADRSRALSWIQIGSVAGPTAAVPSAALRSANFSLLGSGQGSVSTAGYVAELPALIDVISAGKLRVDAAAVPLSEVAEAWNAPGARRVVFLPEQ